jgi:D-threo-aldose 1-dehydrogenase
MRQSGLTGLREGGKTMAFETRRIAKTALDVTVLGLGGATLGGNLQPVSEADAHMLVLDAYDSGIRYFDTAPFYGYGKSEHMVGDELRGRRDWILSTKVGRRLKPRRLPQDANDPWKSPFPFEPHFDYSYDGVMRSYEDSLQRLGLNRIDIVFIHDVDVQSHGKDAQPAMFEAAMAGAYKALDQLRRTGDIKAVGIGVNEAKPIADALDRGDWNVFLLAGRYTLLEQDPLKTLLPAVARHGASIIIGGPFNSGILVGRDTWNYARAPQAVVDRAKAIGRVCDAHNVPLAAAALRFPAAHPLVASVIPGPRSPDELNAIFEWWRSPIPASLWSDLKTEKLLDPDAPVPN